MRGPIVSLASAALLLASVLDALAWERPHADGPNSGFADVDTLPAERPATVSGLGTFAPGTGLAIAADGTVYMGNMEGQLIALEADGTRKWAVNIAEGYSIIAPPVVDSTGGIYVVGTRHVRNDQTNPVLHRWDSIAYRFNAKGIMNWSTVLPNGFDGPNVSAAPNIWKIPNEPDVLMVLVDYHNRLTGGYDTHLIAFGTNGGVMGDVKIKTVVYQAYGEVKNWHDWCWIPPMMLGCIFGADFNPSGGDYVGDPATVLPKDTVAPRPGPAIFTYEGGGTPLILVSNQFQDLVGYTFARHQFNEIFRVHDENRIFLSPPMVLPDGHTVIATSGDNKGELRFYGPNMNAWQPIKGPTTYAAATRMADGRLAVVERFPRMSIINGQNLERTVTLPGESIVSAAASRTHLFVSTAGSFLTYDPATWQQLAEISWVGGGTFTPAVGPYGHVYGMASNILFVFPPPRPVTAGPLVANPDGPLVADPGPATTAPANAPSSQRFSAPVTNAGHRLFACQELDGDDCGKSTNKAVALAFCQQRGFTAVDKVDTETRTGQAARLDGQFCRKHKCKVFDEIVCRN